MKIGNKLKLLRKGRKMTLKELSEKSGVQIATLSRMEHDIMTGTLESHMRIVKSLGVSLSDFYREIEDEQKTVIFTGETRSRESLVRSKESVIELLTTDIADKKMMPVLIRINKGASASEEKCAVGMEKLIYLVEGRVKAKIGEKEYNLRKGDSLYFDASLPHTLHNTARTESLVLSVLSPPLLYIKP